MLSILKRGTAEAGGATWEFHGDSANDKLFYITPQPQFVMVDGLPKIQIVEFETSGPDNGSGYCQLEVELGVPDGAIDPVKAKIKSDFGIDDPVFETLAVQSGTIVSITYPDGEGGTKGMQVNATDFGSNTAIFQIPLDEDQMKDIKKVMSQNGTSPFQINYMMAVPSFMPAVTADIEFDAQIAFQYEVTAHEHTHWARSSTYTYDIKKKIKASNASKIAVNKVDPSISRDVVKAVREWAQDVVDQQVAEQVKEAIAMNNSGQGTQSFSASELTSFKESYAQNETIMWRLRPQAILPSFGQLGLTVDQIHSLEPTIDKRQFVVSITPNASFAGETSKLTHDTTQNGTNPIKKGTNPYMDKIKPLKRLEVTVRYPTLRTSAEKTFTFTDNQPNTWKGDWDDTAGGKFSLDYVATYENGQQVTGSKDDLDVTMYTLGLADIGTLNVTFDASKFFAKSSDTKAPATDPASTGTSVVDSLTVDFVFDIGQENPFLKTFTLDEQNTMHTVSSWFDAPATTDYAFTLTYNFKPDVAANPFTSNVKRQNSAIVRVDAPDFEMSVPLLVQMGTAANQDFLEVDIDIFYADKPYFPDIPASAALPRPTQSSPIQFSPQHAIKGKNGLYRTEFTIFANSNVSPLQLSASAITSNGDTITWGPLEFDPISTPNLLFWNGKLFTYLDINPTIVDWQITQGKPKLKQINFRVKTIKYTSQGKQVSKDTSGNTLSIAWDPQIQKAPSAFYRVNGLPNDFQDLSFVWEAEYVYEDGTKKTNGTQDGTILALPKNATTAHVNRKHLSPLKKNIKHSI